MVRVVLSVAAVGLLAAADTPKSAREAIAGSWRVVACELEHKLLPEGGFQGPPLCPGGRRQMEAGGTRRIQVRRPNGAITGRQPFRWLAGGCAARQR